ncbi:Ig-like domain-containing protein [Bacillus sp. AFS053548]|uniref:Ig-like domain-containing protein n=1 Tax=Bacillus sp. AFS053548 TaxID=2033505 RepID=UPI0025708449|nr:Ig-like domain-containing protein [Bacillus sp. AFS053548]
MKVLDRTAPNAPKITSFFTKGTYEIKGTAEVNTTIVVLKGNKVIAKVKVSTKGTFTVKLPKPSKGKTEYTLYSVDQAGNASVKVKGSITIK